MADGSAETGARRTRGLDRAFEILDFLRLRRKPMRPNEIAQQMGVPRSSVYELVNQLIRQGVLEYRDAEGRVFLGRKLYFLGAAYADQFDLMQECDRLLTWLVEETRETSQLCMLEGDKYVVAQMREGSRPFRISANIGEPVPIPWTASGRLLVGHLSNEEILEYIPPQDFTLPNEQKMDPAGFIAEVRQATADGHYTFNSAVETFTHCFAVPIYDGAGVCIATLCLVTPKEDGLKNHAAYLAALKSCAREVSATLGHPAAAE